MGWFDRIRSVVKGKAEGAVSDIEKRNPEAVYAAAIDEGKARLAEHKKHAAGLVALKNAGVDELAATEAELKQVLGALQAAVAEDEDEVAVVLLQRSDALRQSLEDKATEVERLDAQIAETRAALSALRDHVHGLQEERERALATLAVAEARIQMDDLASGMGEGSESLARVRDGIESLKARAHEGYLDEDGESIRGRAEAMGRKASEASARRQLEQLKAQMRGEAVGESDGEDDATSPSMDDAPPKRSL